MRYEIFVYGIVQGVGFRPFIYNKAIKLGIKGYVTNTSEGVYIQAQADLDTLNMFINEIKENPPALSNVEKIEIKQIDDEKCNNFEIRNSVDYGGFLPVAPDMGICDDCLNELFDKSDRRYKYPFINCTNCGPRYSIIEDIPYDRPKTTMKKFKMCEECLKEYKNPLDRRFHAQPNACSKCGPKVSFYNGIVSLNNDDAINIACKMLNSGKIIAIKGIGGFNIAVDATNEEAVKLLRKRKIRYGKPFAVMVYNIDDIYKFAYLNEEEKKLVLDQRRPIVILKSKKCSYIASSVKGNLNTIGVMLPYTPLHYLVMKQVAKPLVMTSGNISEEPIIKDNDKAFEKLKGITDGILYHDRDIFARIDDSVCFKCDEKTIMIRRARGYAPKPIYHVQKAKKPILSLGAQDKVTICLSKDNMHIMSQHIGDIDNKANFEYMKETIERYEKLFRITPEIVAYDKHPGYITHNFAKSLGLKAIPVQHHHAHIASCMAENGLTKKVIGVAYDGTGYGDDGKIWGAEIMVADLSGYRRMAHLKYIPLIGGESAIKNIYKIGLSYMMEAGVIFRNFVNNINEREYDILIKQWQKKINCPQVSSMGRLFDAIAAVTCIKERVYYEGQAAQVIESMAQDTYNKDDYYPYAIKYSDDTESPSIIDPKDIITSAYFDYERGLDKSIILGRFHNSIINFTVDIALMVREKTKVKDIVLTGGVFQNKILLKKLKNILSSFKFNVYIHGDVPPNDGGISLGQALIASKAIDN